MRVPWFSVCRTAAGLFMIGTGGTLWLAPTKFIRVYRKVAPADKAARAAAWEQAVRSASGRFIGIFMLAFGCVVLWLLYSPFHLK